MGLGKTIEVIGLILVTLDEMRREATDLANRKASSKQQDDYVAFSHATLIVVPPTLVVQWQQEIKKAAGSSINVSLLPTNTGALVPLYMSQSDNNDELEILATSDVVLTTYDALTQRKTSKLLSDVHWGRIVLDEMQEIRSSTTLISHNCEKLLCDRRWMLSGTPLFEGIDDLRGELNFLRLEPFAAKLEDGFFQFAVKNFWDAAHPHAIETLRILGLVTLRRAKDMTIRSTNLPILGLKPLTVEFIPIPQTPSERALYCWMEYLVASELNETEQLKDEKDRKCRTLCLRLLREFCITPMLLNGGLGVPSQLNLLNTLMVQQNRRTEIQQIFSQHASKRQEINRVMSCERALRFLTQVQRSARINEDFVTNVSFGTGGGATRRDIAHESVEARYAEAEEKLQNAITVRANASKKRATLRWHLALELVTIGFAGNISTQVSPKFSSLWKWRHLICLARMRTEQGRQNLPPLTFRRWSFLVGKREQQDRQKLALPPLVSRGWRPSSTFLRRDLYHNNPEFSWAHPIALQVDYIPDQVSAEVLKHAMYQAALRSPVAERDCETICLSLQQERSKLKKIKGDGGKATREAERSDKAVQACIDRLLEKLKDAEDTLHDAKLYDSEMKPAKLVKTMTTRRPGFWSAIVQFRDERDARCVFMTASKANGIPLSSKAKIPNIESAIGLATEKVSQLESENAVHPSRLNQTALLDAKKRLALAKLGPRIAVDDKQGFGYAILSKPVGPYRSLLPRYASDLVKTALRSIQSLDEEVSVAEATIFEQTKVIARLEPALKRNVMEDIAQMSAFETLEALRTGDLENTQCPICLSSLGSEVKKDARGKRATIAMINCGHFFCTDCLDQHVHRKIACYQATTCPNCRKQFSLANDVIYVDHRLKDEEDSFARERQAAKSIVQEASKILERSNGQLDAKVWRALYLAFDLPLNVPNHGHPMLTALPREILTHFRSATGMEAHCSRSDLPAKNAGKGAGLCSKVQALLSDLPLSERSVVFSSSKECIRHLVEVLTLKGIGCRALFTGQSTAVLKQAVTDWEEEGSVHPSCPVFLVQAGAAASGLTLTAASKMFIMEPFLRVEEEQQAYARCHRYGQQHAVEVKCYYTPVSVESRLLSWRKRAQLTENEQQRVLVNDTHIIVRDMSAVLDEGDECNADSDSQRIEAAENATQSMFLLGLIDSENLELATLSAKED